MLESRVEFCGDCVIVGGSGVRGQKYENTMVSVDYGYSKIMYGEI